jgi:hypothetical protein
MKGFEVRGHEGQTKAGITAAAGKLAAHGVEQVDEFGAVKHWLPPDHVYLCGDWMDEFWSILL